MLLKPHGSGFEFFIAYYLCVTVILLQTPRSRLMCRKKIRQLSHFRDFLLTQLSSFCFLTKSSLKFSIFLFVFLLSEIVTVHFIFVYVTISRTDYH